MLVKTLTFVVIAVYNVLADQYVSLELNVLDDPSVVSSKIDFVNSQVLTHDVNPGFYVDKVTQSGLLVWKSLKTGHRATNAILFINEYGPRLINLTLSVGEGQSQLLVFIYTLQGWVNFNNINPFNINFELPESDDKSTSPLNITNGELYFKKDSLEKEDQYADQPAVLDLNETVNSKFEYTYKYTFAKYTYNYKPKRGYFVDSIKEGKTLIWSQKNDQNVTEIVVDKQSDEFVSVQIYYLDNDKPKSVLYIKVDGGWELSPTNEKNLENKNESVKTTSKTDVSYGEFLKPLSRPTKFDYSNIPLSPLCRGCTYEIDGITHHILYFSNDSKFHTFVDGSHFIIKLPDNHVATSSCFYTKNDKILFVDIIYTKDNQNHYLYFEKNEFGYSKLTRALFDENFKKYKETPVTLDISTEKEGYTVKTTTKNGMENKFYTPSKGYVIKTVSDEDTVILEVPTYVVEVTVNKFSDDKKLMLILYQNGAFFKYDSFTYYPELGKWTRVSEYFYYKMLEEFSQSIATKHPTLDISNMITTDKFMYISKNELMNYYTYNPKPGIVLSSVMDSGRMVWTPRYPNEECALVWYNYKAQLLHVFTKADTTLRNYFYEKSDEKWSFINENDFKKMFSFMYATNVTANIRYNVSDKFKVEESGNMFYITPKKGYLINRVRYGDKIIWIGSENLKCTSFYLIYGKYETYLYLTLTDSKLNVKTKYFKTTNGDMFKWKECDSSECSDNVKKMSYLNDLRSTSREESKGKMKNKNKLSSEGTTPLINKILTNSKDMDTEKPVTEKENKINTKTNDKETLTSVNEKLYTSESVSTEKNEPSKTVKLNKEVVKNDLPTSYDYLTGKQSSLPALKYENKERITYKQKLSITNEQNNKSKNTENLSIVLYNSAELQTGDFVTIENDNKVSSDEKLDKNKNVEKDENVNMNDNNLSFNKPENTNNFNNNNENDSSNDTKLNVDEKPYVPGIVYLENLKNTKYGEFRDAREYGFNYLLFTPYPKHPIKELRDEYEVIWKSHTNNCVAVSVLVRDGSETMIELFIKTNTEVVRKHFEYSGYRWRPMRSDTYDYVCKQSGRVKKTN